MYEFSAKTPALRPGISRRIFYAVQKTSEKIGEIYEEEKNHSGL